MHARIVEDAAVDAAEEETRRLHDPGRELGDVDAIEGVACRLLHGDAGPEADDEGAPEARYEHGGEVGEAALGRHLPAGVSLILPVGPERRDVRPAGDGDDAAVEILVDPDDSPLLRLPLEVHVGPARQAREIPARDGQDEEARPQRHDADETLARSRHEERRRGVGEGDRRDAYARSPVGARRQGGENERKRHPHAHRRQSDGQRRHEPPDDLALPPRGHQRTGRHEQVRKAIPHGQARREHETRERQARSERARPRLPREDA